MPSNTNISLECKSKRYQLFANQSLIVWTVTSPQDRAFNLQLRFIQDNAKKIDFTQLTNKLKQYIKKINSVNKLFLTEENKLLFFSYLKNIDFNLKLADIIQDNVKTIYENYGNQPKLSKEYNENLLVLFSLSTVKINNLDLHIGYEKPKNTIENDPIHSIYIFEGKTLLKKIYFFPIDETSLKNAQESIKNVKDINTLNLEIPFVAYDPKLSNDFYNKDIQIRIDLQTIIAETLTHLKQVRFFRKDNTAKTQIFKDLAKDIAAGKSFEEIKNTLNQHDKWAVLAQHRDLWGFFTFFKSEPHSLVAWNLLKEKLSSLESNANNTVTPTYN